MVRQAGQPAKQVEWPAPLTISRLAKQFGLARSTLLHYDRIGLLKPASTSTAGYRLYGPAAGTRLARIVELRAAGLSLETIKQVLEAKTPLADALEQQVRVLNRQLSGVREKQRVVLALLQASVGGNASAKLTKGLSKESWTRLFRTIGMSDADMHQWHVNFETSMPEAHREFLESLGLEAAEVKRIRDNSRSRQAS